MNGRRARAFSRAQWIEERIEAGIGRVRYIESDDIGGRNLEAFLEAGFVAVQRQQPRPAGLSVMAAERGLHLDDAGEAGAALEIAGEPEQRLCIAR